MEAKPFTAKDYAIVCKEISKNDGRIAVYEVETDFDNAIFTCLKLRSRFNPELSYYVTKRENMEKLIKALKLNVNFLEDSIDKLAVKL